MNKSESIKELASALAKAQAVIEGATKDKTNPAFRSKYADLGNCWDAARKPLTDNGFAVIQPARLTELGVEVETMLVHSSGEFVSETLTIPLSKRDAHGVGSAITYGRRFGLCAMVGISPEDDDGNHGAGKNGQNGQQDATQTPWTRELADLATDAAKRGTAAYKEFWQGLSEEARSVLVQTKEHTEYKRTATQADKTLKAA